MRSNHPLPSIRRQGPVCVTYSPRQSQLGVGSSADSQYSQVKTSTSIRDPFPSRTAPSAIMDEGPLTKAHCRDPFPLHPVVRATHSSAGPIAQARPIPPRRHPLAVAPAGGADLGYPFVDQASCAT